MTERSNKAKMIQMVKIGQKQLGIDDDCCRLMLKRITGKNSATKCSIHELSKVLFELKKNGAKLAWFGMTKKPMEPTAYSPVTGSQKVKSDIAHKIRAVWIEMGKQGFLADHSEQALNKFIRNMLNRGRQKQEAVLLLVYVHTLNQTQAIQVLEAFKSWHKREMLKALLSMGCIASKDSSYSDISQQFQRYGRVAK